MCYECGRHAAWVFMLLRNCRLHSVICLGITSPGARFATRGGVRCWTTENAQTVDTLRKTWTNSRSTESWSASCKRENMHVLLFVQLSCFAHLMDDSSLKSLCMATNIKEPCREMTRTILYTPAQMWTTSSLATRKSRATICGIILYGQADVKLHRATSMFCSWNLHLPVSKSI